MRIGVDVDGVLADFNANFIRLCVQVTGHNLFPAGYEPTTWNYPESLGYTSEEVSSVWAAIKADGLFWRGVDRYQSTTEFMAYLNDCANRGDDLYFITDRMGTRAKEQTEEWLLNNGMGAVNYRPITVLLTAKKGLTAQVLGLDVYIDDKRENCIDVAVMTAEIDGSDQTCKVYLLNRPWNQDPLPEMLPEGAILRTDTLVGIAD